MTYWFAAVLMVVGLAGIAPAASAAEVAAAGGPGLVAQVPGGSTAVTAEEAPSSIGTGDQVRAFVVLGVCVVAIIGPAAFMMVRARRRRGPPAPATER